MASRNRGVTLDRAGRPVRTHYPPRKSVNKGKRYPPNPPTPAEIMGALDTLGDSPQDLRLVALVAVLWRGGLGISEALALAPGDLDYDAGHISVRSVRRTAAKRHAAMDAWGFERVRRWQEVREHLPAGLLFCILRGPTVGQDWSSVGARAEIRRLARSSGVGQFVPQQLRYAHAVELLANGVPPVEAYRQLGLSTARNNRAPALLHFRSSRVASEALKPPGAEKALRAAPSSAYSLVRRAAQASDAGYRKARTPAARRAWNDAVQALHRAEEAVMLAAAEDYGA